MLRHKLTTILGATLAAFSLLALAPGGEAAADWPEKNIKFVIHTGAGGGLDTLSRKLASLMEKEYGWSITVENRQGGKGAVAMAHVLSQPADGYTWLGVTTTLASNIALGTLPVKVSDLTFITMLLGEATAVAVRSDSRFQGLKDFVAYMKANPNELKVGGSGRGGNDFVSHQLQQLAGYKSSWIPFDSGKEPIVALLGNHIDISFLTPGTALPQLKSGDLRLLALSTPERSSDYPDTPTFKEQGFDITGLLFRGLVVKAGTPQSAVDKVRDAYQRMEKNADWIAFAKSQNAMMLPLMGDDFRDYVAQKAKDLRPYFKSIGAMK